MAIYDYLKRQGCTRAADGFARECKGLPQFAGIFDDDPKVETPAAPVSQAAATDASATGAAQPPAARAGEMADAMTRAMHQQLPSVNLLPNSEHGLLADWWSIFYDTYSDVAGHPTAAAVRESAREYPHNSSPSHAPSPAAATAAGNANDKRTTPL
ncbi:hypothetical protein H4R19_000136 [Coemansia spiralis]|nr:hypothetical protein H4R19_000136 [Coemansia spiralis]